jgi:L-malate glycosyltransferase
MSYKLQKKIFRALAIVVLATTYGGTYILSKLNDRRRKTKRQSGKILVIGTFHNPNWFHSHIEPLCRCGIQEVILVCDQPMDYKEKLRFACPPRLLAILFSRAGAKFIWAMLYGIRYRPDLYMGYHIFPAALSALAVARILNRPACYQVTSGPLEIEGGGWHAENRLLSALGHPSPTIEKIALKAICEFNLIIVRGTGAKKYLRDKGYNRHLAIITGSAAIPMTYLSYNLRDIDIIFIGRLTECKRPEQFVTIIGQLVKLKPSLKTVIVGDGPDEKKLTCQIRKDKLQNNIQLLGKRKDVETLLSHSKIFVLTSRSEGLSIAMIEAMISGVVPVVADVGDLKDLVQDGINGYVVDGDDIATFTSRILKLLNEPDLWEHFSLQAIQTAKTYSSVYAISKKWQEEFNNLMK